MVRTGSSYEIGEGPLESAYRGINPLDSRSDSVGPCFALHERATQNSGKSGPSPRDCVTFKPVVYAITVGVESTC